MGLNTGSRLRAGSKIPHPDEEKTAVPKLKVLASHGRVKLSGYATETPWRPSSISIRVFAMRSGASRVERGGQRQRAVYKHKSMGPS